MLNHIQNTTNSIIIGSQKNQKFDIYLIFLYNIIEISKIAYRTGGKNNE